jgi:tRNA pseudouridine55 synthase
MIMKAAPVHGLLVLDKPGGLTSRAAVDRALTWFPRGTRVGHTGTLDPLATGVLVLCIGSATRLTEYVQDMAKTYQAGLLLGARSDTDDADGTVTSVVVDSPPDRETVTRCLEEFVGEMDQVPPAYSAAKVTGQRAYDLARKGKEVTLKPRRVRIYALDLRAYQYPRLELEVHCGKGTYIRSLARDLGERLGCGALVECLRRTRVGPFSLGDAVSLDIDAETAGTRLLPLSAAVSELNKVCLDGKAINRLRRGGTLPWNDSSLRNIPLTDDGELAVFDSDGKLALIAVVDTRRCLVRPGKVLAPLSVAD